MYGMHVYEHYVALHMKKLLLISFVFLFAACSHQRIESESFGSLSDGTPVTLYRLVNDTGASVSLTDFGARIVSITVPDRDGVLGDVVLGFDSAEAYEADRTTYSGATLGRYANRIADGRCMAGDKELILSANEIRNGRAIHLHGGFEGFDRRMWRAEPFVGENGVSLLFTRLSPDGEEGYAGNLRCSVTYRWSNDNVLRIEYEAVADATTVVNLSNHVYFNLRGYDAANVLEHAMRIYADRRVATDAFFLSDGVCGVDGTPYDFREMRPIEDHVDDEGLSVFSRGSLNWFVDGYDGRTLRPACTVVDNVSGRCLDVVTTEPGLLVYPCSAFDGSITGKDGKPFERYAAVALETQHFPDTPHRPDLPQCLLRPGDEFRSVTEYRFGVLQDNE